MNNKEQHYQELAHGLDDVINDYISNGIGAAFEEEGKAVKDWCKAYAGNINNPVIDGIVTILYNFTTQTINALLAKGVPLTADMMSYIVLQVNNKLMFNAWQQYREGGGNG